MDTSRSVLGWRWGADPKEEENCRKLWNFRARRSLREMEK